MPRRAPTNVTTTSSIEGWTIEAYLGPVAVHRVAGTGLFSDVFAEFSDVFGGRSGAYRQQLESLYTESIDELTRLAEMRGGNWVVGFHADFDEISGKNKQMFMLVALGTAVRARRTAEHSTPEVGAGRLAVTGLEVSTVIREQRLLAELANGQQPSVDGWDFLAERQRPEGIAAAVKLSGVSPPTELADNAARRQAAARYLRALPGDAVSEQLYDMLETDPSSSVRVLNVIKELRLGRLDRIRRMLGTSDAHLRWAALQSLSAGSAMYCVEDIALLEELRNIVPHCLLPRPLVARKKMFGEKQEWECVCGSWAAPKDTCGACFRDQYGLGPNDLRPEPALDLLTSRIDALRAVYAESLDDR